VRAATAVFVRVGFTSGSVTFSLDCIANPSQIIFNVKGREREESLHLVDLG